MYAIIDSLLDGGGIIDVPSIAEVVIVVAEVVAVVVEVVDEVVTSVFCPITIMFAFRTHLLATVVSEIKYIS